MHSSELHAHYFPPPRPELSGHLAAGDEALERAMSATARSFPKGTVLVEAEQDHRTLYRLVSGTLARFRVLEDARRQIICIFTPGDLIAVKAMVYERQPDSIECLSNAVLSTLDYREAISLAAG